MGKTPGEIFQEFLEEPMDSDLFVWFVKGGAVLGAVCGLIGGFYEAGIGGAIVFGVGGFIVGIIVGFIWGMFAAFFVRIILPLMILCIILGAIAGVIYLLWDVGKPQ